MVHGKRPFGFLTLSLLVWAWLAAPPLRSDQKEYWHFTIKANIDGTAAEEWIWATMVEIDRAKALPDEAKVARDAGGELLGHFLGLVRASAWRSAYTYTLDAKCKGVKSKKEISYSQSETDNVYVHGQIIQNPVNRIPSGIGIQFRFGVCNHRVLKEDGTWVRMDQIPYVFVGPVRVEGREPEEMRGDFNLDGVLYNDQIQRVKRCGKSWIEQFHSVFKHFEHDSVVEGFYYGDMDMWVQRSWKFHGLNVQCVFMCERSRNREHPHWKVRITR